MSKFYPEPYEPFGGDINVTVDLSNYATKSNVVKNDAVKKGAYDKLVAKVNNIDTRTLL